MPRSTLEPRARKGRAKSPVVVRVSAAQRAAWEAGLELRETMSELVRGAVEAELRRREEVRELEEKQRGELARYEAELVQIRAEGEARTSAKAIHEQKSVRFQYSFIVIQAGVILSTIASSSKRRFFWFLALLAGLAGLGMLVNGFLLFV